MFDDANEPPYARRALRVVFVGTVGLLAGSLGLAIASSRFAWLVFGLGVAVFFCCAVVAAVIVVKGSLSRTHPHERSGT